MCVKAFLSFGGVIDASYLKKSGRNQVTLARSISFNEFTKVW